MLLSSTLTDDGIFIINVGSHQMENIHPSYSGWDYGIKADLQRLLPEFEETVPEILHTVFLFVLVFFIESKVTGGSRIFRHIGFFS